MRIEENPVWVYYIGDDVAKLEGDKCGKWMYFFEDPERAALLCREAVEKGVVAEAKHSKRPDGVSCFYLNGDDAAAHKRTIRFFLDHDMIRRTKTGKLYNISFKYDAQTYSGEYGDRFRAEIRLSDILDLVTGEWKI